MDPSKEDIELAISNLVEKTDLPDPEHYPRIVKTMITHELYEIERKRYEQDGGGI